MKKLLSLFVCWSALSLCSASEGVEFAALIDQVEEDKSPFCKNPLGH